MGDKLSRAMKAAFTSDTAGWLCKYDEDSCQWIAVDWVCNAKAAETKAGLPDGRCVNLAINMHKGKGSINGFALVPRWTKSWLKKGGVIEVTFPNNTTATYTNAERLSDALGVSRQTALRYIKKGSAKGLELRRIQSPVVCTMDIKAKWNSAKKAKGDLPY